MKIYLVVICVLLSIAFIFGQDDPESVAFVSYWNKSDTYNFRITKTKKVWEQNELTKNDSSTYTAVFSIIDSTDASYKIRWSYNNDYNHTYDIPSELQDRFEKYAMIDVIYSTTELGEFTGVENWQEVGKVMTELVDALIEALGNEKDEKDGINKALLPLKPVYNSKQGIEQIVLKELQVFHFPFGAEFTVTDTIEYIEQLPNMFGGDPIKANAKLFFQDVDFEKKRCVFINQMSLDPEDMRKLILGLIRKMGLKDEEMESAFENAKFDIVDSNRFEYYYYPGIPIKIETSRVTIIKVGGEDGKSIETLDIELVL